MSHHSVVVCRCAKPRVRGESGERFYNCVTRRGIKQPTDRPTMRWLFQCFEGVSLVMFQPSHGPPQRDFAGLEPLHEQVAALLGPQCEKFYKVAD